MKVIIKGTKEEVENAKNIWETTCMFNSQYCDDMKMCCKECEEKHNLKINYIVEESEDK